MYRGLVMDPVDRVQKNIELRDQFLKLNSSSRNAVLKEFSSAERAVILKIIKKNGDVHVSQRDWDNIDNRIKSFKEIDADIPREEGSLEQLVDNVAFCFNFLSAKKANKLIDKAIDRQGAVQVSKNSPIQAESKYQPIKTEQEVKYDDFKKSRKGAPINPRNYSPSPADRRGQTFKGVEQPLRRDEYSAYNLTLRSDAIHKENENINSYLTRVYNEYTSGPGCPRGFVFAGPDFAKKVEGKHPALHFLEQHIESLKSLGIKKIYLEQLTGFYDGEHATPVKDPTYLLHQFFNGELSECPYSGSESITQIIHLAHQHGMEVIGAEVQTNKEYGNTAGYNRFARLNNFNCGSAKLIRQVNEPFVVFAGAAHGKQKMADVPGLSDYLDCPCIGLASTNLASSVEPGTHRFTGGEYGADAVFSNE